MELEVAMSGLDLKVRDSVSNGEAWHFSYKMKNKKEKTSEEVCDVQRYCVFSVYKEGKDVCMSRTCHLRGCGPFYLTSVRHVHYLTFLTPFHFHLIR